MGKNSFEEARALARRHQLSPDVFTEDGEPRCLDFETGRELTGDDALRSAGLADE